MRLSADPVVLSRSQSFIRRCALNQNRSHRSWQRIGRIKGRIPKIMYYDCMLTSRVVVIGIIIIIIGYLWYQQSDWLQLKCQQSTTNGKTYCVRPRENARKQQEAVNLLGDTVDKCQRLVEYVSRRYPNDKRVQRLSERFDAKVMTETVPSSDMTAYSENKGEKVATCLNKVGGNDEKANNELTDESTLMFVALHELTHIMTVQEGHPQIFWHNFRWLLTAAKEAGIHEPVDYKQTPQPFCGMKINDNPYFDLSRN